MKEYLSQETRDKLKLQHRREKNGRTRDRIKAVLLSDKGWSYRQIAEALLIDEETISRDIDEYISEHKLRVETGGSKSKLNSAETAELLAHLEQVTYLKISDIVSYVRATFSIDYTASGMQSWLQNQGFSYKKPQSRPSKADPIKQE